MIQEWVRPYVPPLMPENTHIREQWRMQGSVTFESNASVMDVIFS